MLPVSPHPCPQPFRCSQPGGNRLPAQILLSLLPAPSHPGNPTPAQPSAARRGRAEPRSPGCGQDAEFGSAPEGSCAGCIPREPAHSFHLTRAAPASGPHKMAGASPSPRPGPPLLLPSRDTGNSKTTTTPIPTPASVSAQHHGRVPGTQREPRAQSNCPGRHGSASRRHSRGSE